MPSIYGYARVSTTQQADEGQSLGVQQRQLEGWAHMQGATLAGVYVERGVSGSTPLGDRPEGTRLLTTLERGDTVVAAKLDRMFRSALDALQTIEAFKAQGISLVLLDLGGDVSGNGISKLVLTILAAVAEAERDRIRERVATVKKDQRDRGRYLGGKPPIGYRVGPEGALERDEQQQAAILRAVAMRQSGTPLRTIRATLAAEGVAVSLDAVHRMTGATAA